MSYVSVAETSEIIDTIRKDLSTVTSITVGDYTVSRFDPHDPLGIAFYVYSLLKVGYSNVDVDLYPNTARYWVEEKINDQIFSPYLDRDFGALGLFTYALCKYKSCPSVNKKYSTVVESKFKDTTGLFNSFMPTVLVGLGLSQLASDSQLTKRFEQCIQSQLENKKAEIFNDAKNFFVAHLWATEKESEQLRATLIHESLLRSSMEECLPRDRIYYSYVLLEEVERLSRKEQLSVQQWVLDSLSFLQTYSHEPSPAPEVLAEFGSDILFNATSLRDYGYQPKPHQSRIMLAVGLLLNYRYKSLGPEFFSFGKGFNRYFRAFSSALPPLLFTLAIVVLGLKFDLPLSIQLDVSSNEIITIAKAVILKMILINSVWTALIALPCMFAIFAFESLFSRKTNSEYEAYQYAGGVLARNWRKEILIPLMLGVLEGLIWR